MNYAFYLRFGRDCDGIMHQDNTNRVTARQYLKMQVSSSLHNLIDLLNFVNKKHGNGALYRDQV